MIIPKKLSNSPNQAEKKSTNAFDEATGKTMGNSNASVCRFPFELGEPLTY